MRHRQQKFPSPFDLLDFDPERLLWIPGRKKIFLPSVKPKFTWKQSNIAAIVAELWSEGTRSHLLGIWDAECVPSRGQFLTPRTIQVPATWNDVVRSDRAWIRSSYGDY